MDRKWILTSNLWTGTESSNLTLKRSLILIKEGKVNRKLQLQPVIDLCEVIDWSKIVVTEVNFWHFKEFLRSYREITFGPKVSINTALKSTITY